MQNLPVRGSEINRIEHGKRHVSFSVCADADGLRWKSTGSESVRWWIAVIQSLNHTRGQSQQRNERK